MKSRKRIRPSQRGREAQNTDLTPAGLGLDVERYQAVLRYLFDRPVPEGQQQEWYWDDDHVPFDATPLEWTRFQTAIFANAATDFANFNNEQVGMGLIYLMDNGQSQVPFAVLDPSVPLAEAMRMMQAMPSLWRDCIAPRLSLASPPDSPIGSAAGGRLWHACYMWFDVWPTFRLASQSKDWRDAFWHVLVEMLEVPCRAVQIAALHGLGHSVDRLDNDSEIERVVGAFVRGLQGDETLRRYAESAREGRVQ
jgi:hypothetical protein